MLSANGIYHNSTNGTARATHLPGSSDYDAVTIDVTSKVPRPAWRDQFLAFMHHIQWTDADGITHGLTLRSDSLQDLMSDLRMVKAAIKASREKRTESQPQQATHDPQVPAADVPDVQRCHIHHVDMARRWSKRTGGHYFAHKTPNGDFCYGRKPRV